MPWNPRARMRASLLIVLVPIAGLSMPACGVRDLVAPRTAAAEVALVPGDTALRSAGRLCYTWTVRDARGRALDDRAVDFAIVHDERGLLTADADAGCVLVAAVPGAEATVQAAADTAVARATVRLLQTVTSLTIAPADTTVDFGGGGFCYRWTALDAAGQPVEDAQPVFHVAANAQLIAVDGQSGCVTVLSRNGTGSVEAKADSAVARATVRVRP